MLVQNWNEFATLLATFARRNLSGVHRGAMMIPFPGEDRLVAVVFGNEPRPATDETVREVTGIRVRLQPSPYEELGCGVTPDGRTWTLLFQAHTSRYETGLGQAFQKEMLRAFVEDALWHAGDGPRFIAEAVVEPAAAR